MREDYREDHPKIKVVKENNENYPQASMKSFVRKWEPIDEEDFNYRQREMKKMNEEGE